MLNYCFGGIFSDIKLLPKFHVQSCKAADMSDGDHIYFSIISWFNVFKLFNML